MSEIKYDLIVVGGGIMGSFHAYFAHQAGMRVAILEKDREPAGATVRNFGQIVPSGMDRQWQRLGRRSLEIYSELEESYGLTVRNEGSVYLASDPDELQLIQELHQLDGEADYPSQLLDAAACQARFPLLKKDYCLGGLFYPQELSVDPLQLVHRLHSGLKSKGIAIEYLSPVRSLETVNSAVKCEISDGRVVWADQALVCSGSEFKLLFPRLFQESDTKVVKLQMLALAAQAQGQLPGNILTGLSIRRYESFSACPSYETIKNREAEDAFWKKWGIHILFKQEPGGQIILGDSHVYSSVLDSDQLDHQLNEEVYDYFLEEAARIFDLPSWNVERRWHGIYSQSNHESGLFEVKIDDHIHVVTGIGGKGMTASPGLAEQKIKDLYGGKTGCF